MTILVVLVEVLIVIALLIIAGIIIIRVVFQQRIVGYFTVDPVEVPNLGKRTTYYKVEKYSIWDKYLQGKKPTPVARRSYNFSISSGFSIVPFTGTSGQSGLIRIVVHHSDAEIDDGSITETDALTNETGTTSVITV